MPLRKKKMKKILLKERREPERRDYKMSTRKR